MLSQVSQENATREAHHSMSNFFIVSFLYHFDPYYLKEFNLASAVKIYLTASSYFAAFLYLISNKRHKLADKNITPA